LAAHRSGENEEVGVLDPVLRPLDRFQQRHPVTAFPVAVVKKFGDDRGSHLAALITYYGFLAMFPLLLVFVTVLGFVLEGDEGLRRDLIDSALADFPVIGTQLRRNVQAISGQGVGFVIGLVALVWGALGVAHTAQHAMAEVWSIPVRARPGFLPRIGRSVLLLATLAAGVIGTSVLTGAASALTDGALAVAAGALVALALNVPLYLAGMRILTAGEVPTRDLVPGAVLGGVAWTALQYLGSWLVTRQLQHTSELYGFFAIVLGLMFWIYLGAQILVYASEVNVVRARRLWPRSLQPPPLTSADERTLTARAKTEERRPEQHVDVSFDEPDPRAPEHTNGGARR
jgi:YihY family inner membrane protein